MNTLVSDDRCPAYDGHIREDNLFQKLPAAVFERNYLLVCVRQEQAIWSKWCTTV